jgi:levanase/fructan beta-fructosidase
MKNILLALFILFVSIPLWAQKSGKEPIKYNERLRSQFHYSTEKNRMGSPFSMVKTDTLYHLFYQYNPVNMSNGFMHWGHATSNDLLKWEEKAIALSPVDPSDSLQNTPRWGSVVGSDNQFVAWVTFWGDGIYQMKSKDGNSWTDKIKTTGTELLSKSEPYVFFHQPTKRWIMVAYDRPNTTLYFMRSADGINWEKLNSFRYNFGAPQFIEMPVDRKTDDTRWVLITDNGTYMIGTFDGENFKIVSSVLQFNMGSNLGGSTVYFDKNEERYLMATELKDDPNADSVLNSQLSIISEIALHQVENGLALKVKPIGGLDKQLADKPRLIEAKKVYPGMDNSIMKGIRSTELRIKGVIDIANSDQFGMMLLADKNRTGYDINFNLKRKNLSLLGTNFDFVPTNKKIEIEILVDRSVIEVYIDGGRYAVSNSIAPSPGSNRYEIYTMGGEIMIDRLEICPINSVWRSSEK